MRHLTFAHLTAHTHTTKTAQRGLLSRRALAVCGLRAVCWPTKALEGAGLVAEQMMPKP